MATQSDKTIIQGANFRILPYPQPDGNNSDVRIGRYGDQYTVGIVRKQHGLADEGTYWVANGGTTAITGQTTVAYDATKPSLLLTNGDTYSNTTNKRVYIDYIALTAGATAYSNATSNTGMFFSYGLDAGNRYSSGGTALTVVNPNMDLSQKSAVSLVYAGAIVTTTASGSFRTITSQRVLRLPVSATVLSTAIADRFFFNFGGVETTGTDTTGDTTSATLEAKWVQRYFQLPPTVIGPQQSFLFNINCIAGGAVTAGNFNYEIGFWER